MSKIKNGGLDQYGTGPFEQQQFETAGVEGLKAYHHTTGCLVPYTAYKDVTTVDVSDP